MVNKVLTFFLSYIVFNTVLYSAAIYWESVVAWPITELHMSTAYADRQCYYTPPAQRSCWGYIGFTPSVRLSVRPSRVRPATCVRSVASTVLVGSISYLCILSSNFRWCVACKVSCKNFKIWSFGNFLNFVTLTLCCFDLGSDVNH